MKFFTYVPGSMPVPLFNWRHWRKWLLLLIFVITSAGCNRLQTKPVDSSHPAHPDAPQSVMTVMPDTLKTREDK
ncbi:MAG: hypothetical protein EP297_05830 [Gammaproteobacteria bacterium]|nr:MAG: hypothetical protein EP297_05830 [Gammaproteobacteria bacterium]